jgi:serine/threonine protein kinase
VSDGLGGPSEFAVGAVVAGYRLEERIGSGGMAVVYRAYDPRLERQVALKVLAPGLASDEAFRQRFIRESRAAAAVDEPHIIPVYEAGEDDGVLFIAMRLIRGGDVRTLLDREGRLTPRRATEIVSQVAAALDAAHARGLVHRDVKPANMLLEPSGDKERPDHVYLADFGLTKSDLGLAGPGLTSTGQFMGTLDYVAPEQIEGRPVDGRTDLYALACAAFELLTGAPPFQRDGGMAVIYAQVSEPPPLLSSRRPGLPAEADGILNRALAKVPDDRYASCQEFASALRRVFGLSAAPAPESRPAHPPTQAAQPVPPPLSPPPSRRPAHDRTQTAATPSGPTSPMPPPGPDGPGPGGPRRRPFWRSPVPIAVACVIAVAVGAGAFLLSSHQGGHDAVLAQTSTCGVPTPKLRTVSVDGPSAATGVSPFAVKEDHGGRYSFTSVHDGIEVRLNRPGQAPELIRTIPVPGTNKGLALTSDGRYLLAANGRGATVIKASNAESGASPMVAGTLQSPGGGNAVGIQVSPDDHYAFVTLQSSAQMAVFNLRQALASGFGRKAFVGYVPLHIQPVGISAPSGQWLYVTSFQRSKGHSPSVGTLSVVDWKKAETDPSHSVVSTVDAGCSPARVVVTQHGSIVWVTARDSNTLLAFSASLLRSDPAHALRASLPVGPQPIGLTPIDGGAKLIVSDSNSDSSRSGELAVVSTAAALNGGHAVLGVVPVAGQPRQLTLAGGTVLVTAQSPANPGGGPGKLQVFELSKLP